MYKLGYHRFSCVLTKILGAISSKLVKSSKNSSQTPQHSVPVLKRSRPPGHCLHCLPEFQASWLEPGSEYKKVHRSPKWFIVLPCLTSFHLHYLHFPSRCQYPAASSTTFGTVGTGTVAVWSFGTFFAGIVAGTSGTFVGTCSCARWGITELLYTDSTSIMSWKTYQCKELKAI